MKEYEVRVKNEETGGEKGRKLARFDLIPVDSLWMVAEHFGAGAAKYEDRNWERGYDWSLSYAAMQRHAMRWWGGEQLDDETGTHHLAAVIFHAMAMMHYDLNDDRYGRFDDRPMRGPVK